MRRFADMLRIGVLSVVSLLSVTTVLVPATANAAACSDSGSFLGLPHWYRGLEQTVDDGNGNPFCSIQIKADNNFRDIWTIVVNILDILLRLSGILAVIYIIIGGVRYIVSQGESSSMVAAKQTITRAIIGLAIAISAVLILNFIAGTVLGLTVNTDTYQVSK